MEILRERYLRRNDRGEVAETSGGMFERVARMVAEPAQFYDEDSKEWEARFLERLCHGEFLPNSPTLMNAGLTHGQLAGCFVLPIEDDLDSIFAAISRMARIHQTGGGTGFSFSQLRPREDRVSSTGDVTSGPLSSWICSRRSSIGSSSLGHMTAAGFKVGQRTVSVQNRESSRVVCDT